MKTVFVSFAAALVLAACGGGGGGGSDPQPTNMVVTPAPSGGGVVVSGGGTAGPVTPPAAQTPPPGYQPSEPVAQPGGTGVVGPTPNQPTVPPTGAPPVWCHNPEPNTCPVGTTPTQPPTHGNPPAHEPQPRQWVPGMPRPSAGPAMTPANVRAYDAWCWSQPDCTDPFVGKPDLHTATLDQIADWNSRCESQRCRITLPARSGRSLNWWGTDPREIERVEDLHGPASAIPDGDKLVWNFACDPQPSCRIRLSRYDY